jgi:hypothetical protein
VHVPWKHDSRGTKSKLSYLGGMYDVSLRPSTGPVSDQRLGYAGQGEFGAYLLKKLRRQKC